MFTVLGANGYVGSHLSAFLKAKREEVCAITRDGLKNLPNHLGSVFYCIGLTADFRQHIPETIDAHVSILNTILKNHQFDRFIYLSSTRVYQYSENTLEETPIVVHPQKFEDTYNISKLLGEAITLTYPNTVVARLSNVIGDRNNPDLFFGQLLQEAKTGVIHLKTTQHSSKDYIYLHDAIHLLDCIMHDSKYRIYNIASGHNTSHAKIISIIQQTHPCDIDDTEAKNTTTFPTITIQRVQECFGFTPTPLEKIRVTSP